MTESKKTELLQLINHIKGATTASSISHTQVGQAANLLLELLVEVNGAIPSLTNYAKLTDIPSVAGKADIINLAASGADQPGYHISSINGLPVYYNPAGGVYSIAHGRTVFVANGKSWSYTKNGVSKSLASGTYHVFCCFHDQDEDPRNNHGTRFYIFNNSLNLVDMLDLSNYDGQTPDVAPAELLQAFGEALASTTNDGLMSKEDKAALNGIPTIYAKKTDIPSLTGYAKTSDIPSLEGYAQSSVVNEAIEAVEDAIKAIDKRTKSIGITPISSGNANDLTNTGTYYISGTVTNAPATTCYIEVWGYSASLIVQRSVDGTGAMKQRVYANSAWGNWKTI